MQSIWILNAVHMTTTQRYSIMKEIFVYVSCWNNIKEISQEKCIIFTDKSFALEIDDSKGDLKIHSPVVYEEKKMAG
jgi:hypothetical protein